MQVTNPGNRVFLACVGDFVDAGAPVEVPDADGVSLVEQGWKPTKPKPKRVVDAEPATAEQED